MTEDEVHEAVDLLADAAESGDTSATASAVEPLLRAQADTPLAASALLWVLENLELDQALAIPIVTTMAADHQQDALLLAGLAEQYESVVDINDLNAAPICELSPLIEQLAELAPDYRDTPAEPRILRGLATGARVLGRQQDEIAERSYRRLIELLPDSSYDHYNLGLFCKTRGRFAEGVAANRAAIRLAEEPSEASVWNLGICATGAGEGQQALAVWEGIGQKIRLGRFDLPEGGYPLCKVLVVEHPLAERSAANDHPGENESVWVERLSPCHGIIRSVLIGELGLNYGDVVLFDGAPLTYHVHGEDRIAVFPHLATLVHSNYQLYEFVGTQNEAGQLAGISAELGDDAVVYVHTENVALLCRTCLRDGGVHDHSRGHRGSTPESVMLGVIAAPPALAPQALLQQLDASVAGRPGALLYVPELCAAAGLEHRAAAEDREVTRLLGEDQLGNAEHPC